MQEGVIKKVEQMQKDEQEKRGGEDQDRRSTMTGDESGVGVEKGDRMMEEINAEEIN